MLLILILVPLLVTGFPKPPEWKPDHHDDDTHPSPKGKSTKRQSCETWPHCCKMHGGNSGNVIACNGKSGCGTDSYVDDSDDTGSDNEKRESIEGAESWPKCCKMHGGNSGNELKCDGKSGCGVLDQPIDQPSDQPDMDNSEEEGDENEAEPDEDDDDEDDTKRESIEGAESWPKCCKMHGGNSGNELKCGGKTGCGCTDDSDDTEETDNEGGNTKRSAECEPWPHCCSLNKGNSAKGYGGGCKCGCDKSNWITVDNGDTVGVDGNGGSSNKRSNCEPWPTCCKLSGGTSGGGKIHASRCGGAKNTFMDNNQFGGAGEKDSYMGSSKSSGCKGHGFKADKDTYSPVMESASSKGGFKNHDFDTHTMDKSCEGDFKECNKGWNACKTPCFGVMSYGGNVFEGVGCGGQKAVKAVGDTPTANAYINGENVEKNVNGAQKFTDDIEAALSAAELQENDKNLAEQMKAHREAKFMGCPTAGVVNTGSQASEPFNKVVNKSTPVDEVKGK